MSGPVAGKFVSEDYNEDRLGIDAFSANNQENHQKGSLLMSDPKVSVIIPCYNYGAYIDEAVDSVLSQTFTDYEIVIVNDGSTDAATIKLLTDYRKPKTKVFHTQNQGVSAARNYGIEQSSGEYILPLDPDDKIGATYLEKAVPVLELNPRIGIVYCKVNVFGTVSGDWNWPSFSIEQMLYRNVIFNSALFRKRDWLTAGKYKTDFLYAGEDWDLWLSILEQGYGVFQIPEVLYYYRRHDGGQRSTTGAQEVKDIHTYEHLLKFHRKLYEQHWAPLLRTAFRLQMENAALQDRLSLMADGEEGGNRQRIINLVVRVSKLLPRSLVRKILGT